MPEGPWYDALPERDMSLSERWGTDEFRAEFRDWCASGDLAGHARGRSDAARQGQQDARGLTPR
jgi:hypothetical protein